MSTTRIGRSVQVAAWVCLATAGLAPAADPPPASSRPARTFRDAKTWFQTNVGYDPRLAIATDGVVVHRHGDSLESLTSAIGSWKARGFTVGRMFFADSDATLGYWKGKWDGKPHEDEVERGPDGKEVLCGYRPYMLPTPGWTRYLEEQVTTAIRAGADAILPEEPLAHSFTGYEEAFKPMYKARYGRPWEPENASPEAHFLTCQLKAELYLELEQHLARFTRQQAENAGRKISFLMPVHGLYSNRASRLVAPMGAALESDEIDGYVGQVWTGPVNWCLANYGAADKSFFASALALYGYFASLTAGTEKGMWLLADPVEDDPNHKWSEFEEWYRHCLVAELMFSEIDTFEIMPWPDRIFLPGYQTGGGTPAPEKYRISLLSAIQVLQEIRSCSSGISGLPDPCGIGVALADSTLWEPHQPAVLDGVYGLLLPLYDQGMWPSVCLAERWTEPGYLEQFRVIVLSYENFKPTGAQMNAALAGWVKAGGILIALGGGGDLYGPPFWWTQQSQRSPLHHLMSLLGADPGADGEKQVGKGWVIRRQSSPRECATPQGAEAYRQLIEDALGRLKRPADECRRGFVIGREPFIIAHGLPGPPRFLNGPLIDVFNPDLPVVDLVRLKPGDSVVYRDVSKPIAAKVPSVLHCTHRLMEQLHDEQRSRIVLRGPAETPAVVRLFTAGRNIAALSVADARGASISAETVPGDHSTVLVRFGNQPDGAIISIAWKAAGAE